LIDFCPSNKKNGFAKVIMKDKLVKRINYFFEGIKGFEGHDKIQELAISCQGFINQLNNNRTQSLFYRILVDVLV